MICWRASKKCVARSSWTKALPRCWPSSTFKQDEGARAHIQVFVNQKLAQAGFLNSKLTFRFRNVVVLAMLAVGLPVAAHAQDSGMVFLACYREIFHGGGCGV